MTRSPLGALRRTSLMALLLALPCAAHAADTSPPRITHVPIERAASGQAILVRCEIADDSAIFAPSLLVRGKGMKEFDTLDLRKTSGNLYEATIPAEQVTGDLEYVIEAFDEIGNGPARVGSPESPLVIEVVDPSAMPPPEPVVTTPPPPPPDVTGGAAAASSGGGLHTKWWFWTLIVGAAAGGATAVFLATRSSTPESVELVIQGPDPTQGP
jgi:hypothetical protein